MKLVVDSNRIIAALIKNSFSRRILMNKKHDFVGVYFSQKEVKKYEKVILAKSKLSKENYQKIFDILFSNIVLFDENEIEEKFLKKAFSIMEKIDEKDTPFLALALQENCGIWSDDKHFFEQKKVRVWSTKSLAKKI